MGSKAKAKTQTYDTGGLYGSASTGKGGTNFNPDDFQTNMVNTAQTGIMQNLNQMVNPTYDSEIFKAQTAQRNRLANQAFENNLINPLASRGLTRGSSVNQMSNQFANKLADMEVDAMANEDQRVANVLSGLMNTYQVPFNMMTGMTNTTNQAYQNAVQQAAQENAARQKMYTDIATAGAQMGQNAAQLAPLAMASDKRLKENIKRVGRLDNGLNVYVFNYKGENTPQIGLLAQDVQKVKPEAVDTLPNGYLAVRYDKAVG